MGYENSSGKKWVFMGKSGNEMDIIELEFVESSPPMQNFIVFYFF